jgi:pimeloyl-ACP methyl ester carboxylesterase
MAQVYFTDRGNGKPVLLIHGFPFNQNLWTEFAEGLSSSCRVLTVDLPGFGKSPLLKAPFSLTDVATALNEWLEDLKIPQPVLVGHSLGGYVVLEMAHLRPDRFSGLVLFHSTAMPDNAEKKQNRNKVLEFIDNNGVRAFTSNFIPPLFADPHHPSIGIVRQIASLAGEEAVKGYTIAMRDRKDHTTLLKHFHNPIMIISGEKDQGIPPESIQKQAAIAPAIELHMLPEVAHMGMFENREKTLELVSKFVTAK